MNSHSSTTVNRKQFDYRKADDVYDKSLSGHTRRAYRRVIREFFAAHREKHPNEITTKQVLAWRDALIRKRQKPATVNFKLSVVRSFYEYLRTSGEVTQNPTTTRFVPHPELPEELAGRALRTSIVIR